MTTLRELPSVSQLLLHEAAGLLCREYGRDLTVEALRARLDEIRHAHQPDQALPAQSEILTGARAILAAWTTPSLVPVINATGVIIHTNLGRAPLSRSALDAMASAGQAYTNLEYDLATGKRGSRYELAAALIRRLTGAEDALVVNNNAAAVLLVLGALANRRRVLIPRSQLIEIGGGFRIPDVLRQSGARLVEIGTTNRVHLHDYEDALSAQPVGLVLSVHPSNFRIIGFTTEPERSEIAELAKRFQVPYVEDLGSGTLLDTARFGLAHEPTVQESLAAGVDLVTFSGDKLLGGPQAGIIAGSAGLLARIKRHPLARAVRADKTTYAGLSATLLHYVKGEAYTEVPVWRMISAGREDLAARAAAWRDHLHARLPSADFTLIDGESTVGGGSLPGETLPSRLLAARVRNPQASLARLRSGEPPVIARVQDELILFDPRTVFPEQDPALLDWIANVLK